MYFLLLLSQLLNNLGHCSSYQVCCELFSFGSIKTKITMAVIGENVEKEHLLILITTKNVIPA